MLFMEISFRLKGEEDQSLGKDSDGNSVERTLLR